jgi:Cdc6-like AAA superfamily ATPase
LSRPSIIMSDHDENSAGNRMPIGSNSSGNNSTTSPTRISEAPLVSDKRGESAVVMAVARKGPPIPCFAGFSKLDAASSATNTTGSNKSSTPSTSLLLQATFDTSTTLTQEADNYMDDDDDNDNDGSVSSGAGSLLSGGSVSSEGEEEEASSSSDDDDDEAEDAAAATISLEQRMLRNQQRNAQFLQSLNQKYQDQVPAELKPGSTKKRKKKKKSTNSLSDEDDEAPDHQLRGMLRQRKLPLHQDASVAAATAPLTPTTPTAAAPTAASISLAQRLQALAQQYPYREGQIRHLTAMLHGSLGAAAAAADRATGVVVAAAQQQQSQEAVEVVQHVPAPIFISGPRGSGKTSVVKDVMTMLKADNQQKQQDQQQSSDRRSTTHMHSAYINCVTLEPSSIERLVADAYKQLRPESSSSSTTYGGGRYGRRLRKRRQTAAAGLSPKQPHSPKPQSTTSSARVDTTAALSSEDAQEQLTATEEGRGIAGIAALPAVPLQNATSNEQQHDTMVMEEEEEDLQQQPRLQPRRAAKVAVPPTNTSLATTSSGKLTARRNKPNGTSTAKSHSAVEDDPHRTEDAVETSHSAVVAFGRSLQRYFGVGSQQRERRAAILVLDGAERLLTLSARKKTSEKANCLAELLLLPKVMRLNLTIVVISRYVLLYGTRLDNIASPYKSTATLSGSVGGLTIQFPAYKDHQVMKKVRSRYTIMNEGMNLEY